VAVAGVPFSVFDCRSGSWLDGSVSWSAGFLNVLRLRVVSFCTCFACQARRYFRCPTPIPHRHFALSYAVATTFCCTCMKVFDMGEIRNLTTHA
jgi:hypothetical protein